MAGFHLLFDFIAVSVNSNLIFDALLQYSAAIVFYKHKWLTIWNTWMGRYNLLFCILKITFSLFCQANKQKLPVLANEQNDLPGWQLRGYWMSQLKCLLWAFTQAVLLSEVITLRSTLSWCCVSFFPLNTSADTRTYFRDVWVEVV